MRPRRARLAPAALLVWTTLQRAQLLGCYLRAWRCGPPHTV
jgi:hypothetical protein